MEIVDYAVSSHTVVANSEFGFVRDLEHLNH